MQPDEPQATIQAARDRGPVRRTAGSYWDSGQREDIIAGLQRNGTGGTFDLSYRDRIRFRRSGDAAHGTLEQFQGTERPYIFVHARKGSVEPEGVASYASLEEALTAITGDGYDQWHFRPAPTYGLTRTADPGTHEDIPGWKQEKAGITIRDIEGPEKTADLTPAIEYYQAYHRSAEILETYGFKPWSPDGSCYLRGIMFKETGKVYEHGSDEYNQVIYGEVRSVADELIPQAQHYHDHYFLQAKSDASGVSIYPHQLPRPWAEMEGYKFHYLADENYTSKSHTWSFDPHYLGHIASCLMRDSDGNQYRAVFEAQVTTAGIEGTIDKEEISRRLAQQVFEQAQDENVPVVLAGPTTAAYIQGKNKVNGTMVRAYGKGGQARKAFNDVFGINPNPKAGETRRSGERVTLEEMWTPTNDANTPKFSGVVYRNMPLLTHAHEETPPDLDF